MLIGYFVRCVGKDGGESNSWLGIRLGSGLKIVTLSGESSKSCDGDILVIDEWAEHAIEWKLSE